MMDFYLDPANQALVDEIAASRSPPLQDLTVKQFRALLDTFQKHTPLPGVTEEEFFVPFNKDAKIKVFLYKREHATQDLPVIFYLHGGGWIGGNHNTHDSLVRDLALRTGCAVVFPEYSLAPEKKYPTQQEECFTVMKYVAEHGRAKGLLAIKFATASDSAGGQLAVALALLAHKRHFPIPIAYQVLFNPVTDTASALDEASEFAFFNGPFLTVPFLVESTASYIPDRRARNSALASPLLMSAKEAAVLPPTLIVVSSVDPLRSEGESFGHLLQRAGVSCAIVRAEGQIHDSVVLEATRTAPTPQAMVALAAQMLRAMLVSEDGDGSDLKARKTGTLKGTSKRWNGLSLEKEGREEPAGRSKRRRL